MKQLSFIKECTKPSKPLNKNIVRWQLFVDGASRKNPGPAGAGIYLKKNDEVIFSKGYFLGHKTNNQAEYLALLLGIFHAKKLMDPSEFLMIMSDSELLIKQCLGEYKVRNSQLKVLFSIVQTLLTNVNFSFCHVRREVNQEADALANEGIDTKKAVPREFLTMMQQYVASV